MLKKVVIKSDDQARNCRLIFWAQLSSLSCHARNLAADLLTAWLLGCLVLLRGWPSQQKQSSIFDNSHEIIW